MAFIRAASTPSIALMISLLALTLGPWICSAGPIPHSSAASQLLPRETPNSQCSFAGNAEIYGLGIRIGVYLQWVSGFLANSFHADSVRDMLATNTIFLLALFTALTIITQKETVEAIEVAILLQFCFGFLFSVSTTWGLRVRALLTSAKEYEKRVYFSLLGSTIRLCLASAICSYNLWFWFKGLDKLNNPDCQPLGLLFTQVDLLRRARVFFKIWAVLLTILFGFATITEIVLFLWNWSCYTIIITVMAILIRLHGIAHAARATNSKNVFVKAVSECLSTPLTVIVVILTPWIMLNKDTGVGFKRHQSWLLLLRLYSIPQYLHHAIRLCVPKLSGIAFPEIGYTASIKKISSWIEAGKTKFNPNILKLLPAINLICLVWSITAIELMIKWNGITDVHTIQSVGQLIPFIIGVVGFVKLFRDIQLERIQHHSYDAIMKLLLHFDPKNENAVEEKELNLGPESHIGVAKESLEITIEEDLPDPNKPKPEYLPQAAHSTKPSPLWEGLTPVRIPTTPKTMLELHLRINVLLAMFRNWKEELEEAKKAEILRLSIGDKIMEILRTDAKEREFSIKKTNAILALSILRRFKDAQIAGGKENGGVDTSSGWRKFSKELHDADVNPHVLAVRWLKEYTTFWWVHFNGRWEVHRAEVVKGKKIFGGFRVTSNFY